MIFVDTNVISEPVRPKPDPKVMAWLDKFDPELAIATAVLAEIAFGVARLHPGKHVSRLAAFLTHTRHRFANRIHAFDEEACMIYGHLMGETTRAGLNPKTMDGIIAATALRHNATLATRNVRDFQALGVKVVNPWG
jgi:predicted nucleic acid-binding protein